MLNSNKRSIELNTKTAEGKEVMEKLIRTGRPDEESYLHAAVELAEARGLPVVATNNCAMRVWVTKSTPVPMI